MSYIYIISDGIGLFYRLGLFLFIRNYTYDEAWDEIIHLFPNRNGQPLKSRNV